MPAPKPVDVVLAERRTPTPPPTTHDRLGRPLLGPCLIWEWGKSTIPKDGYARIKNRAFGTGVPQLVHRVAFALANGTPWAELQSVPELDHLCRVRACSAAAHLEPVTHAENMARGDGNQNRDKEACDAGHAFDAANTIVRADGSRRCRECHRIRSREAWRARNRPDLIGLPPLPGGRPRKS